MSRGRARTGFGGAAMLACVLACAGCSVGPDFETPKSPVNPNWRATSDPRVTARAAADRLWWKAFNDSTLNRLIDTAARENLPLQITGLRIAEARARLGIATGEQYPQTQVVYGHAGAVKFSDNQANVANFDREFFDYEVGFDAAWELDFWGKYRRGVESERANVVASVADYQDGLVTLIAEVARTYATIRTFEVLIELARENVHSQEEGLAIADSRFRNGATTELDVAQATTLLESTRATIPQLQVGLQQAQNALSMLLGQAPGSLDALWTGPKEIPKAPKSVAIGVPAELLRRRPDIRRAELQAAAQCARIGVAKADLYPSFTLGGTIGVRASTSDNGSGNLFSSDSLFYLAGVRVNWPFLNYGRITNNVRVQDAKFQQLLVNYQNTVLKAAQEVGDALAGFLNAQEALRFEQAAVEAAKKSQEIALIQYREGAVDYQRVLDAERSVLQEQNRVAQSTSSLATNWIAIYKALGGGWELGQGKPFVPEATQRVMKERTSWGDLLSEPTSEDEETPPPRKR